MKIIQFLSIPTALVLAVSTASAGKLVIKGSDTLGAKLVPQLAEAYKAKNPDTSFEIAAEGSTTGLTAIIDSTADIGMSSRHAKVIEESAAEAKGAKLTPTIVAYDGLVVIVNVKSPLANLTRRQVEQIFTGDVTDWSALGGAAGKISIYTRNTSSGTYSDWKELAMKKPEARTPLGNPTLANDDTLPATPERVAHESPLFETDAHGHRIRDGRG